MASFDIGFQTDFTADEVSGLCDAIGCTEAELPGRLNGIGYAALLEYANMMLGAAPITTASDLRERRLLNLIENALGKRLPDTNRVSRLFSLAPSAAKALVRSVAAKHRHRLRQVLDAEIDEFLATCVQQDGEADWTVTALNPILIEVLNERLRNAGLSKAPIRPGTDALGVYVVPNGSYEWIKDNR